MKKPTNEQVEGAERTVRGDEPGAATPTRNTARATARPTQPATSSARSLSRVKCQTTARSICPPSSGIPGSRLKPPTSPLIHANDQPSTHPIEFVGERAHRPRRRFRRAGSRPAARPMPRGTSGPGSVARRGPRTGRRAAAGRRVRPEGRAPSPPARGSPRGPARPRRPSAIRPAAETKLAGAAEPDDVVAQRLRHDDHREDDHEDPGRRHDQRYAEDPSGGDAGHPGRRLTGRRCRRRLVGGTIVAHPSMVGALCTSCRFLSERCSTVST